MILNDGVVSWRQRCRFDGFTVDIFWPKWFSVDGVVSRRQRCRFDCFIARTFLFFSFISCFTFFFFNLLFHESWETFVVCAARAICSPTTKETLVRRSFNRPPLHTHTHTHTHTKKIELNLSWNPTFTGSSQVYWWFVSASSDSGLLVLFLLNLHSHFDSSSVYRRYRVFFLLLERQFSFFVFPLPSLT